MQLTPGAQIMPTSLTRRPVIGINGNMSLLDDSYPVHAGGTMNSDAVAEVSGCLPIIIPPGKA